MSFTTTAPPPPETCIQGHRSTLILPTAEGGSICLLCLSNLLSNPKSPTVHVSYALSQLSQALSQPQFLHSLLTFHSHFLISPLVSVLSNFDDEPIATQTIDLIQKLCDGSNTNGNGNHDVHKDFVSRVSDWLSSGSLAWSRRQLYMLHCFGVLLDNQDYNLCTCLKNRDALIFNLVTGLQLSNDEIQGEIMFVLYRLSLLHCTYTDDNGTDELFAYCPKLLHLSLDILMKSQHDDVRLNCVAFLTVLVQRGFLERACSNHAGSLDSLDADNFTQITEDVIDGPPLEVLFAEAVKGPLLSSDSQVQTATLDLVSRYLSSEYVSGKEHQVFIEENIADYIFEILRLSGSKDQIVNSSIQVLDLLSNDEKSFRQRLAIGFSTLVPILRYVAEIPFQPVQCRLLKLILNCIINCPGIVSTGVGEEITSILAGMFKKHIDGELGMLPDSFTFSCSILVAIMKCSSCRGNTKLASSVKNASRSAVWTCLGNITHPSSDQMLHLLYLLKEAYAYDQDDNFPSSSNLGIRAFIIDIFRLQVSPWFMSVMSDMEEETIALGVIETIHSILLQDSNDDAKSFAESLVSSSWSSVLFGCLGLFPTEKMKWRVYLIFSSIVDVLLGSDSGQPISDSALHLPSDPTDLLFLLGQKSSNNLELFSCQSAVLLILYISSIYNDRIADDKLVLASLEQFILLNSSYFFSGASSLEHILVNLYGLYRGLAKMSYQIPYSLEAERTLFQLLAEKDWDSFSTKIHLTSLRWLFQQEKLSKPLSYQILKFCRCNVSIGKSLVLSHETSQNVDLHVFAELIASGENHGAMIFICLLGDLLENACKEYDIIAVLKACTEIIEIAPVASDEFCMHGIDVVLLNIYNYLIYSSPELFMVTSELVCSILKSVHSESISNSEAWTGISVKLLDYMILAVASDGRNEEVLIIAGILSMILHHSTMGALTEASKTIILSAPLITTINTTISEACSKGPGLLDHNEGTRTGEVLMFVLLLLFFSLRSLRAILPDTIDFQTLLDEGTSMQPLSYVSIRCHDLCKLLHFGSVPIKLISSFCLVELFTGMSDYTSGKPVDMKFREGYLFSISAVLEGQIYFSNIRIALNCSQCLSHLMTWKQLKVDNWCRLIVEELVMSLSNPSVTSKFFMVHHNPAVNVAVALLKLSEVPSWITKVFDDSSIQSIIQIISPSSVTPELVTLFRALLDSSLLNSAHIADLNRVFQACRRHTYTDDIQDCSTEDHTEKVAAVDLDHVGKARAFLLSLMLSQSYPDFCYLPMSQSRRKKLLEEIDLFAKCLMEEDES